MKRDEEHNGGGMEAIQASSCQVTFDGYALCSSIHHGERRVVEVVQRATWTFLQK
jgi:hypothetical protein